MPAYNEEGCISEVIKSWLAALSQIAAKESPGFSTMMIIVNDGSKDKTGELLDLEAQKDSRIVPIHQQNGGHGVALRNAYEQAVARNAEWVFHVDSDDQFDPSDLEKLWSARSRTNFVLGRRLARQDALHRLVITRIVRLLNFIMYGCDIPDVNVPYRLIKGSYLAALLKVVPNRVFAPNIFLAVLAKKDGQDLVNIGVQHRDRHTGTVSIVRWKLIKICFRCAWELWEFRLLLDGKLKELKNLTQSTLGK